MIKEIGGYIELELKDGEQFHKNAVALNSGRNAIRYAIRAYNITRLHVPYYICPVIWDAINDENCKIVPYHIDENLLPAKDFEPDDYILYVNYFGVCAAQVKKLTKKYPNLIVDNAMAFYMPHYGIASAYSPRKFFGLPDGGFAICNRQLEENFQQDTSYHRFSHLIKRVDCGSNFAYADFNKNDESLNHEPIKFMSNLTYKMCANIDYQTAKEKRLNNYSFLAENLAHLNKLQITLDKDDVPMYYPLIIENDNLRKNLVDNKIYIPQCWRNLNNICKENSYELYLHKYMFPLIIDQRYTSEDLKQIIKTVEETILIKR